ncbi:MAG TPA: hypothetical protein VMT10_02795 [Solirubrobacteraceae bacterium]|nr:hypothetical protein [Solirubrobacteraceae bacterium]
MPFDTFVLIAGQYDDEADAIADYDAVHDAYKELGLIDTYDAAVLTKDAQGKVSIVKKHEEPTRQGAAGGLLVGLAAGAAVALFPAVLLGGALLVGGAAGAGLGALAGHVAGGLSRSDLKDLGELLDEGASGLLVITATDAEAHAEAAITRTKKQERKQIKLDAEKARADSQAGEL